jgi:hypothetical protein
MSVGERPIEGFTTESKRAATRLTEELKKDQGQPDELRSVIPLFEKFCDMYSELIGGSYGAGEITYKQFHEKICEQAARPSAGVG